MWRSLGVQVVIFVLAFQGISWLREARLLDVQTPPPQITLPALEGGTPLPVQQNPKRTLVYFFAPWCSICHASIDNVQDLYAKHHSQLDVVLVAMDFGNKEEVRSFLSQHSLTMPVLLGNEAVKRQWRIEAYPTYYVLDSDGMVENASMGYSSSLGLAWRTR